MTVLAIIAEYNPFHYGHKYHLEESMKKTGAEYSLALMSGSFQQRGEPSFVDKWTKAKMAVDNGLDLVIELPFIFSSQTAEVFAQGGIDLLNKLNIVDYLSFGSEFGELEALEDIASLLVEEPDSFQDFLLHYLSLGNSYAVSRSKAIEDHFSSMYPNQENYYSNIVNKSNNILGIEYLKALKRSESKINPLTIRRKGSGYSDLFIKDGIASASGIRRLVKDRGLGSVKGIVPEESYLNLTNYLNEHQDFNYLENYNRILLYLLRTIGRKKLSNYLDVESGLENRIIDMASSYNNINQVIDAIVTKRYTRSRIQRILIHLLHGLDRTKFNELSQIHPLYLRVLGSSSKGLKLLKEIKENSSLPIINKFADYKKLKDKGLEESIIFDKISTDIFYLGLSMENMHTNKDYYTSPYIRK